VNIGGVELAILILGILAAVQDLTGLDEKIQKGIGLALGFAAGVYFLALNQGLVPTEALAWVQVVVQAAAYILAAFGYLSLPGRAARAAAQLFRRP